MDVILIMGGMTFLSCSCQRAREKGGRGGRGRGRGACAMASSGGGPMSPGSGGYLRGSGRGKVRDGAVRQPVSLKMPV